MEYLIMNSDPQQVCRVVYIALVFQNRIHSYLRMTNYK